MSQHLKKKYYFLQNLFWKIEGGQTGYISILPARTLERFNLHRLSYTEAYLHTYVRVCLERVFSTPFCKGRASEIYLVNSIQKMGWTIPINFFLGSEI